MEPAATASRVAADSAAAATIFGGVAALFAAALAAYVFLLAPGQAWWHGRASSTPRLFARVALSTLFTTLVGLGLAACDAFSLPRLAAIAALVSLFGYLFVARVRHEEPGAAAAAGLGPLLFVLALWVYWPPYETHLAGADSTSYTTAGVHLARAHHLWKRDPLVDELTPFLRNRLFFSVMGLPWKPPYARMPGGLVIDTPDSSVVRPAFFPAPVVWSALFADALGGRYAGGFAPLFGALAVWAFWHFARRRLEVPWALLATALVALNAACYWAARFPLAEPLAWFFSWAGLVALDAYEDDGFAADARLAALLLGAAAVVRVEYLGFVLAALALVYALRDVASRRLTPGFAACFVAVGAAALAQVALLPGSYAAPLFDVLGALQWREAVARQNVPWLLLAGALVAVGLWVWLAWRIGVLRAMAAALFVAIIAAYVLTSHPTATRSLRWLVAYLGAPAVVAGIAGAIATRRERISRPGDGFLVVLVLVVGGLLVYAPHVYPAMPWAARRYVPVVAPALLLWAVMLVVRQRKHSRLLAATGAAVLAITVAWPARAMWRLPFYENTYAALRSVVEQLPADGTLLVDNRLISLLVSTPLWLAFDRNSLPVDVSTVDGRETTAAVVQALEDRGPVFILKPSAAPQETIPSVAAHRVKDFEIELALPEQTPASPPQKIDRYVELVSLFRLARWQLPPSLPKPLPSQ